ncbi:glycosyltransferase family 1 protein [Labilibacter sediminis]|nr:glycosyltransferase family 1 protein [Labilibacter sediminis]
MKVLLLGEYSSLHYNLAHGLKKLGVNVTVASNGDFWKNIPRDIDLKQPKKLKKIRFIHKLIKNYPNLIGYDVVQLIAPNFLMSSPILSNLYFEFLKKGNSKFFMGACGMEYIYIKYALTGKLKHSVFYIPEIQNEPFIKYLKGLVNNKSLKNLELNISKYCDGIIATSNGYYDAYRDTYPEKTCFIPLPIDTNKYIYKNTISSNPEKVRFFLGLMNKRIALKGTDKIHNALKEIKNKYPNDIDLTIVNSIPFNEYTRLVDNSHVLCDQLYASGIGMNGLIALSKGLIVGGCGDDDLYSSLGEKINKPILNLTPSHNDMVKSFERLLEEKHKLKERSLKSREFVVKHHDSVKIAQQYLDFWKM